MIKNMKKNVEILQELYYHMKYKPWLENPPPVTSKNIVLVTVALMVIVWYTFLLVRVPTDT